MSIYDKLLAYLFFGKHVVPFNGKKETYQFLRNVPFNIKMCQLVTKYVNLWQRFPVC